MTARPRLVIASNNVGKIREFRSLLGDHVEVLSMVDLGIESPEETGLTFEENAELKARIVYGQTGLVTIADDSGLEVDALHGEPGVYSARYAGEQQDDADNRALLLQRMQGVSTADRTCRFVAALTLVSSDGRARTVRGTCEGHIGTEERGANGFGYDPLFVLPDGRTMAELSSSEKGAISHRGKAVSEILHHVEAALAEATLADPGGVP